MSPSDRLRAFIALELSPEMRSRMVDLCERLTKAAHFTAVNPRWTRPDSWHLTLKFLGDIDPAMIEPIGQALREVGAQMPPIAFSARGLGLFPNEQRPRVLWIGVKRGAAEVAMLHRLVDRAMAPLGFRYDDPVFTAHLTLARFPSGQGVRQFLPMIQSHNRVFCGETVATRVVLFHSDLRPEGAVYSVLAEAPLSGAPREDSPGDDDAPYNDAANFAADSPDSDSR